MSYLNLVTELRYKSYRGNVSYCFLSYFESKIFINIGSLESPGDHLNEKYSRPSLSRLRLSRITAYLEEKI